MKKTDRKTDRNQKAAFLMLTLFLSAGAGALAPALTFGAQTQPPAVSVPAVSDNMANSQKGGHVSIPPNVPEVGAANIGKAYARVVNTSTLRLREKPSLNSKTLRLLSGDTEYEVLGEENGFAHIAVDTALMGYVSKDYISIRGEYGNASSGTENGSNRIGALSGTLETGPTGPGSAAGTGKAPQTSQTVDAAGIGSESGTGSGTGSGKGPGSGTSSGSGTGLEIGLVTGPGTGHTNGSGMGLVSQEVTAGRMSVVAYAKQFLGTPYVYGGTSLTNGVDCSGFTQAVFSNFNITTGRTTKEQAAYGKMIQIDSVRPGDLLFYANNNEIDHVGIYIGDGQIIHASTTNKKITIAQANYQTPCRAVSFLD